MRIVKIGEAKSQLSRHLEYVRRGGRVRICDRNVPIADLVPIPLGEPETEDATLAELERKGVLRRGSGRIPEELFKPGPRDAKSRVLAALLEERRLGR